MHVLQLLPSLEMGGLEVMVARLSEALHAAGIEVTLGELTHRGALDVASVFRERWVGGLRLDRGATDLACHWRLWRFLCRRRFTLVHVHNVKSCAYLLPAAVMSRTPVVYSVHGQGFDAVANDRAMRRVHRLGIPLIHRYVAVSEDVRMRLMQTDRVPSSKIRVIRNGIDVDRFRVRLGAARDPGMLRQQLGIPDTAFVIGSVGRFSPEKNYPLLIEAFAALAADAALARGAGRVADAAPFLVLVGDGSDKTRIVAAIDARGVASRCVLPGFQAPEDWYGLMDVFCLSSHTEGTPMTLLEAAAAGIPAVVTDVGGNADVVADGQTGWVVPPGNAAALTAALARLARAPDMRREMGVAARERIAKRYALDTMVSQYLQVYRESVKGSSG